MAFPLLAAAAPIIGAGISTLGGIFTNQQQIRAARDQQNFQDTMSRTAHQREVEDLQAAGLNPMLSAMHTGATTPPGAQPQLHNPAEGFTAAGGAVAHSAQALAQIDNIEAEAEMKRASAEEIRQRTPTYAVNIDVMRQQINESVERIAKIQQDVKLGVSSAAHLDQQVTNLKATLPQIKASTEQLRTLANLNKAQAIETLTRSGVNEQHANEIYQRVHENLPAMERELQRMELTIQQMSLPGHQAEEAARGSFAGQLGAYLKALLPLQGLMGAIPIGRSKTIIQKAPNVTIRNPAPITHVNQGRPQ